MSTKFQKAIDVLKKDNERFSMPESSALHPALHPALHALTAHIAARKRELEEHIDTDHALDADPYHYVGLHKELSKIEKLLLKHSVQPTPYESPKKLPKQPKRIRTGLSGRHPG